MDARTYTRPLKLAIVIALLGTAVATPCSFDVEPRIFFDVRPDAPIDRFVDGHLGILQPSYARSHLIVAFRYLSGRPPSAVEREGFRELLRHRLDEYPEPRIRAAEQWERLRTNVRGVAFAQAPDQSRAVGGDSYEWIDNCTDDAFHTAAATLAARVKTFGARHPAVSAWLDAQEIVFGNCSDGSASVPEADGSLPEIIRADRRYQMAAADFYAMRYQEARARFLAIARDAKSPWRATARLVAARALIRAESLGVEVADADPLGTAEKELRDMLADRSMAPLHETTWGLLAYATARRDPQQRFNEAAQGLLAGAATVRRARTDLADYTVLWDKEGIAGDDELTDWLRTFQAGGAEHSIERWTQTRRLHWLVAALAHAKPGTPAVAALLEDSAKIAPDSPAYAMVTHHRVRLLSEAGPARAELDRALARDLPMSARNQLLAQRRGYARTLDEFLRDVPVTLVGYGLDPATGPDAEKRWMPPDAAFVLNYWTPLETLRKASQNEALPAGLRAQIAAATGLRQALLEHPDFDLAYATVKDLSAEPYVDPFDYGDERPNWWCRGGGHDEEVGRSTRLPDFLEGEDETDTENERLSQLGSGASWILRTTLARAKSHPSDPRVPEALALAIDGTRWACGDTDTDELAEQAFGVLQRRYGKTEWAQQTKYWHRAAF
jgi:hypothetical protein